MVGAQQDSAAGTTRAVVVAAASAGSVDWAAMAAVVGSGRA
ncbi:hypothetical protein [Mycolicibacterium stellerae]